MRVTEARWPACAEDFRAVAIISDVCPGRYCPSGQFEGTIRTVESNQKRCAWPCRARPAMLRSPKMIMGISERHLARFIDELLKLQGYVTGQFGKNQTWAQPYCRGPRSAEAPVEPSIVK